MSTEEYIPKVGDECILSSIGCVDFDFEVRVDYIGKKVGCYTELETNKDYSYAVIDAVFKPIPTKADVELKELVQILAITADYVLSEVAKEIQKAGFTIPKKVKRVDLQGVVNNNSSMATVEDEDLVDEICNLLGDLVESDV